MNSIRYLDLYLVLPDGEAATMIIFGVKHYNHTETPPVRVTRSYGRSYLDWANDALIQQGCILSEQKTYRDGSAEIELRRYCLPGCTSTS